MIEFKLFFALASYYFVMFATPGPNNAMLTASGIKFGFKKTIMIGDSETDSNAAKNANLPFVLIDDGYTEKSSKEIYHNHLVKNFVGLEKIIEKYIND